MNVRSASISRGSHNLLVVSDLHFGETLAPSESGYVKQVARLNVAFCRFLEYYAEHRIENRPWRLVIAGDMIDFVRASVVATAQIGEEQESARGAVRALDQIFAHHRRVFRDLAAFVGSGNELVIIKGNHDVEFHWDEVQARFTELISEEAGKPVAITFCRWFWYESGLVYIEHGNQYDEFCSFEHVLSPEIPEEKRLEDPISHQTFRAFAHLVSSLDVHAIERFKIIDYVRWLAGLGPKLIGKLAYTYFASLAWMIRTRRRLSGAALLAKKAHRLRFAELTQRFRLSEDTLSSLDELRQRPAGNRVFAGIQMLYMDQIFLLVGTLLMVFGGVWWADDHYIKASVAGGSVFSAVLLSFYLSRQREVESHPKLLRVARKVRRLVKVPFVVFGHSHVPVRESIESDGNGWYFNTGSWSGDAKGGLTHLCITVGGDDRPTAELRRWDILTRQPLKLEI